MMENASSRNMLRLLSKASCLPSVRLDYPDSWEEVGLMAVGRGYPLVEILLRSEYAESGVRKLRENFPQLQVGVGTVLSHDELRRVEDWGADFAVSPGSLPSLLKKAAAREFPYLPGVATPSDIMRAAEFGFHTLKIFPAAALGVAYIRSLEGPFPWMRAVVSGGIDATNAAQFAELRSVLAVSGSFFFESSEPYAARPEREVEAAFPPIIHPIDHSLLENYDA